MDWLMGFIGDVSKLRMIHDWVLIEKDPRFDNIGTFGSIVIPETSNLNVRETKIGKVLRVGPGDYNSKGEVWSTTIYRGAFVYYVRYGKHMFKDLEGTDFVICRESGILAIVDVDIVDERPIRLYPRSNKLWVEEIKEGEEVDSKTGLIKLPDKKRDRYCRWNVLTVGQGLYSYENHKILPMSIRVGDIVWASVESGDGFSWNFDGQRKDYRIIAETECIAKEELS